MSGAVITMIKTEKNLCIFYEKKKKNIKNRATNTENLIPAIVNKVVPVPPPTYQVIAASGKEVVQG
jgi:hypothetical protein